MFGPRVSNTRQTAAVSQATLWLLDLDKAVGMALNGTLVLLWVLEAVLVEAAAVRRSIKDEQEQTSGRRGCC